MNSKKNSCRGNYIRKYGRYTDKIGTLDGSLVCRLRVMKKIAIHPSTFSCNKPKKPHHHPRLFHTPCLLDRGE